MNDFNDLRDELKEIQKNIQSIQITAARTEEQVSSLKRAVYDLQEELKQDFVTLESFVPVRTFVYGIIAIIGTSFLAGLVSAIKWASN
jgi:predicted nuclease with TOPRIM domain